MLGVVENWYELKDLTNQGIGCIIEIRPGAADITKGDLP